MAAPRSFVSRLRRLAGRVTGGLSGRSGEPSRPETSRPETSPSDTDAPTPAQISAGELAELTARGRHVEAEKRARAELAPLLHDDEADATLLKQIQMSASAAGAISLQRQALARRIELWPDNSALAHRRPRLDGRWRETDPDWSPTVPPVSLSARTPSATPGSAPRILHLLKIGMPHRQSGYSVRSMYTLASQAEIGLDVVAVTALDFPVSIGVAREEVADEDVVGEIRYRHLLRDEIPPSEPWDRYLEAYAAALAPVVAEERPDLIHVHSGHRGYEPALVALAVGRALGIPVVYEVRGFFEALWTKDVAQAEHAEIYRRRHAQETRCMREAAAVVTLSESMRQDILARGVAAETVHVVPNAVDPDHFVPRERDPDLAERLGLTGRFVFGYVSNLDHAREGQELLIDAAVRLRDSGIPATALIVGDGVRRERLEAHADEVGARDVVVFTGRVPHDAVADHYALLDVFVVPRIDERAARLVTPLKPYEAMALGVPLVVSDLPALREIIGDGARGESFRTGDAGSLATVLEALHASPEHRERLRRTARDWVVTERDWRRNAERYREIYTEVLGQTPARS